MTRTRLAYVATIVMLLFALLSFFNPWLMVRVLGFELLEGRGLSEMRATYGALFIVMSGVLLWALPNRLRGAAYLRFAGFLWLGAAAGRLASMIIDGALLPFNFLALAVELFIGVPLLLAGFQTPRVKVLKPEPSPLDAYRS